VPANTTHFSRLEDVFIGSQARITASNDTVLGVADGFTATLRIRELAE
jgi:hypothetical protein